MGTCVTKSVRAVLVVTALLAGLIPGILPVHAREAAREDFTRELPPEARQGITQGKDARGKGWTSPHATFNVQSPAKIDLPVRFDNTVVRGAISFDIQRKAGGEVPSGEYRTVFALKDDGGNNLLLFQLTWESDFDPTRPMVHLTGEYFSQSAGLWNPWILLDRAVAPNQWIHVDLVWDDGSGKYQLFVDGRPQDVSRRFFNAETGAVLPDARSMAKDGSPAAAPKPFRTLLSRAKSIRLGINTVAAAPDRGSSPLSSAVLANFVILENEQPRGLGVSLISSISDDTFKTAGISGKLVAGDKVTMEMTAAPGGVASFDMGKTRDIPGTEVPAREAGPGSPAVAPGTYRGSYTIRPGDDWEDGQIVGRFVSSDNVSAEPAVSASKWTIETKPKVTFSIDRKDLPADSASKARIKLVARDANGNPVKGRRLKLTLATTDQYTGTVGAGDFGKQVGGSLETRWRGETDAFGEVEFDYTSGFAAKTVLLTAKDLDSGGVTVDYITAYKEASIDIALKKVVSRAAVRRSVQYVLKVEASRTELTADGRSRSVIRATLLDPNGTTVSGDPVVFTLSSPNGTLRTIQGTTDSSGVATAEYVAGKKIGIVVVTATATLRNAQGQVSIILLADAPAKILLAAKPESLPADGVSRADVRVKVTDINDNPNRDTKVEFKVAKGGGALEYPDRVTDRFGDASNRYTAGTEPGIATILATVRSAIPTEAELAKAQNVLFATYSDAGEEIRIERWLRKKGETFLKGEPLVEYTVGRDKTPVTLAAPSDGTMGEILVEYWDRAEVGQTLAILVPARK